MLLPVDYVSLVRAVFLDNHCALFDTILLCLQVAMKFLRCCCPETAVVVRWCIASDGWLDGQEAMLVVNPLALSHAPNVITWPWDVIYNVLWSLAAANVCDLFTSFAFLRCVFVRWWCWWTVIHSLIQLLFKTIVPTDSGVAQWSREIVPTDSDVAQWSREYQTSIVFGPVTFTSNPLTLLSQFTAAGFPLTGKVWESWGMSGNWGSQGKVRAFCWWSGKTSMCYWYQTEQLL